MYKGGEGGEGEEGFMKMGLCMKGGGRGGWQKEIWLICSSYNVVYCFLS